MKLTPLRALLLILPACNAQKTADTDTPAAAAAPAACDLLQAEEIRQATGRDPGAPIDESAEGRPAMCRWPEAGDATSTLVSLTMTPKGVRRYEDLRQQFEQNMGAEFASTQVRSVPTTENAAAWIGPVEGGYLQLHGDRGMIQVGLEAPGTGDPALTALQLAQAAMNRLPAGNTP